VGYKEMLKELPAQQWPRCGFNICSNDSHDINAESFYAQP